MNNSTLSIAVQVCNMTLMQTFTEHKSGKTKILDKFTVESGGEKNMKKAGLWI